MMNWPLAVFVIVVLVLICMWVCSGSGDEDTTEPFLMSYVPMSDSFYYVPPWRRPRMWWGPRPIPLRMRYYRPYWVR